MKDPYLYPNSYVLVNLFDEKNEQKIEEIEANFTSLFFRTCSIGRGKLAKSISKKQKWLWAGFLLNILM